jgi:DNA-binding MarR family transcriptional regulator
MSAERAPAEAQPDQTHLAQEAIYLLNQAAERLRQHFAGCAAEFNLSSGQGKVLLEMRPDETVPMRTLADRLGYDASNLTGLVDRLEARGALVRRPDADDRRVKGLALTEAGLRLRADLWSRLIRDGGPVGGLTEPQLRALGDLLRAVLAGNPAVDADRRGD